MSHCILVVPTGHGVGLTSTSLGLARGLQREGLQVGFCKPVGKLDRDRVGRERSCELARLTLQVEVPEAIAGSRALELVSEGEEQTLLEEVVALYERAAENADVVVVEGLVSNDRVFYATSVNTGIAHALDAQIVLVGSPGDDTPEQCASAIEAAARAYGDLGPRLVGCVLNKVRGVAEAPASLDVLTEDGVEPVHESAARPYCEALEAEGIHCLGLIPYSPLLSAPRVQDVARALGAQVLRPGDLDRRVLHVAVAAMTVPNALRMIRPGSLVITPGDRTDMLMATALAALSGVPTAALVLSGGLAPDANVMELCEPAFEQGLPLLRVAGQTFEVARQALEMNLDVPVDDRERIELVMNTVAKVLDLDAFKHMLASEHESHPSPPAFRHRLIERAREASRRIVLPEGDEPRTITAASICASRGIARCVLLGDPGTIRNVAKRQGVSLEGVEVLEPARLVPRYVDPMVALRAHRGLTPEAAEEELSDRVVLGTMMLAQGDVDGLVSGAVHTTADTVRPAFQLIRTAPDSRLVSSVFFMCLPEGVLVYGDCAVNRDPSAEELAAIAIQSADSARLFGIPPRVAMISYSTGASGSGADVEKVVEATRLAQAARPDLEIDGPLQYDAASVASVARSKAPDSSVAGRATVFIFPDLNTGNTTYKAVQRSAQVVSIGPMLQGLAKPVNDLSRGALVEDIVFTIALTAIQSTLAQPAATR